MSKPVVSVTTLVEKLRAAEGEPITSSRITDLLDSVALDELTLRPFVGFHDEYYARHLIHRDAHFDILVICWRPGQGTPVHDHHGQLGWAFPVQGALQCVEYRVLDGDDTDRCFEMETGQKVGLEEHADLLCTPGGEISTVDTEIAVHSLAVPRDSHERTVSFHVYSRPYDSCVIFDVARRTCGNKDLFFDTAPEGYEVPMR